VRKKVQQLSNQMAEFISLLEQQITEDGLHQTRIEQLMIFRESKVKWKTPEVHRPGIIFAAQGTKNIYVGNKRYDYGAGNFMALLTSMPTECELIEVSEEKPFLGFGIFFDRDRAARLISKMDGIENSTVKPEPRYSSGIFSAPIKSNMLDAIIRLLKTLNSPGEAAILGEAIIDEIYFRILSEEQGGALKHLLQQHGQIQQISKAVECIQQNMDRSVSVDELANIVYMSSSGFHKKFKEVMHLSPLQYAKSIKLDKAHNLIKEGKSISEVSFLVGYNSPAQFSREYKRQFGIVPSAT